MIGNNAVLALVEEALGRPQTIGTDDCIAFACSIVQAINGEDLLGNRYRGAWSSAREAESLTPLGLGATVARQLRNRGWQPIPLSETEAGCFGLARVPSDGTRIHYPCVAIGGGWWLGRVDKGVSYLRTADLWRAWGPPDLAGPQMWVAA